MASYQLLLIVKPRAVANGLGYAIRKAVEFKFHDRDFFVVSEATLRAGDTATFKAGVAVGHRLDNRSDAPARYLVVGTRATRDTVTYTDAGRGKHLDGGQTRWTDLDGNPSDNPF